MYNAGAAGTENIKVKERILMNQEKELVLRCQPHIYRDRQEPFPVRHIGYTVFREKGSSRSFRDLTLDPAEYGAAFVIEYAVYYDYDIQHMYDLEHAWTAVRADGTLAGCWGTFHGMRLRVDRLAAFRTEEGHPVLFAEPGKHALLPDPALFSLHDQFPDCCGAKAGGGLLVPDMLRSRMATSAAQDAWIRRYMRDHWTFVPAMEFEREDVPAERFLPWPELKERIPELVRKELRRIGWMDLSF